MRLAVIVWLGLVAGCGHLGFDDESGAGGGGGGDGGVVGRWRSVATSGSSACAIGNDASLWCWGEDPASTSTFLAPTQIPGSWTTVTLGHSWADHACGIQTDGTLWCWGSDAYGMLGDNNVGTTETPRQIGAATWTAVSAGEIYTCGIQTGGSMWCWGQDSSGQLGDGQTTEQDVPQQVPGSWLQLAAGANYACALANDRTIWCWGNDWGGAIGNNVSEASATRTQLAGTWLAIAASSSDDHSCAIASDHGVWCWGDNSYGELGIGSTDNEYTPTSVGIQADAIAVGDDHSCALLADRGVWCWGQGSHGEMGNLATGPVLAPIHVTDAQALAVSGEQTCIIDLTGHALCSGRDDLGQLGTLATGSTAPGPVTTPTQSDSRTDWTSITAGGSHACGIAGGAYYCWGSNVDGELGDGTDVDRQSPVALQGSGLATLVAGTYVTIGIGSSSAAWLWGLDEGADGTFPAGEQLPSTGWSDPTAGDYHECALQGTALSCRGDDSSGQLGDGNTTGTSPGVVVAGTWQHVAAGASTTCAVDTAGDVSCWGDDTVGSVGNAQGGIFATPQAIPITKPASWVGVGGTFACAIDGTGLLWCWGSDSCGQLGNGTTSQNAIGSATPMQQGTRTDWVEVALGYEHVCAIPSDHSLWCWGHGGEGAVGNPALYDYTVPTQVGSDSNWAHVAAGNDFTCALKTDGTRWCFGENHDGELGDGLAWVSGFVTIL